MQYEGYLDEVSVWHAAIAPCEIRKLYEFGMQTWLQDFQNLLAYWKFDEAYLQEFRTLPSAFGLAPYLSKVSSEEDAPYVTWNASEALNANTYVWREL